MGAVPWLRRLVAGFSMRMPGFAPGLVHAGFVADKVALEQVFLWVLRFSPASIIPSRLHTHEQRSVGGRSSDIVSPNRHKKDSNRSKSLYGPVLRSYTWMPYSNFTLFFPITKVIWESEEVFAEHIQFCCITRVLVTSRKYGLRNLLPASV
jgi:hypothetical protein